MNNAQKINLRYLKREYKSGLLIPEIQRDYVMGAGGHSGNGSDKLDNLLDALLKSFNKRTNFDFSCVITYCKNDDHDHERLEIYDGQQRLTTLILLYLFCLQREKNEEYKKYKNWYQFCGRPLANDIISKLTDDNFDIKELKIIDFSSFSMVNLLKRFSDEKYNKITSCFFLQNVVFDHVNIGSQNEIEQFFMDLNSGVKLKEYELYKAKLVHHINCFADRNENSDEEKNKLKAWTHKLDNEWLNVFLPFSDFSHSAEEYEVAFLKYCFSMLRKDKKKISNDRIENLDFDLDFDILNECFFIMNSISKLSFSNISLSVPQIVEFSWGNKKECSKIEKADWEGNVYNKKRRCAYWNLSYNDNQEHLSYIIKNVLLEREKREELDKDILVWAYITSLDWQIDYQNEYIRLLKIILNHNVGINLKAWYECQRKGQYLYYAKYGVMNIPDYYGKHRPDKEYEEIPNDDVIFNKIYSLIQSFWENKPTWKEMSDKKHISENITEHILNTVSQQDRIRSILEMRKKCMQDGSFFNYEKFCDFENEHNGVIEKCMQDGSFSNYEKFCDFENKYNGVIEKASCNKRNYIGKVTLSWPTKGSYSSYGCGNEPCFVLLKCYMDKYYSDYDDVLNKIVLSFKRQYEDDCIFDEKKCFWVSPNLAYRIMDRKTDTSKTYTVRGGTVNFDWAYKFDGQSPRCNE